MGHAHGPIKKYFLHARSFRALLDEARIDFLEKSGHRCCNRRADFDKSLGDGIDGLNVG